MGTVDNVLMIQYQKMYIDIYLRNTRTAYNTICDLHSVLIYIIFLSQHCKGFFLSVFHIVLSVCLLNCS